MSYESLVVITKQKPIIDARMTEKRIQTHRYKKKIIISQRKTAREEEKNWGTTKQSESNYQNGNYQSKMTQDANNLSSPVTRHKVAWTVKPTNQQT